MKLKKNWAKTARKAMNHLRRERDSRAFPSTGCCSALFSMKVTKGFRRFIKPKANIESYWWPALTTGYYSGSYPREAFTARIIALELFALACEEEMEI